MWWTVWRLIILYICGYLFIEWIPIPDSIILSDFLISLIMNPLGFFAASIAFMIAVVTNGQLVKEMLESFWKRQKIRQYPSLVSFIGIAFIYIALFNDGWQQATALFSFGLFYGIMSIDRYK